MKGLLVLLSAVALASSIPTLGLIKGILGGGGGGLSSLTGGGGGAGDVIGKVVGGFGNLGGGHDCGGGGGVPGIDAIGGGGGSVIGGARPGGSTGGGFLQEGGVYPVGGGSSDGSEDLSVHDGSQKTSKNTDKSSHDKSSSGSGRKENRADGSGLEEYNQNNAEANRGDRTADTTDTRLHDLSLNGDNSNGSSNGGPEDLSVHDGSQKTSKNTDKSSHDKSSSGSGRKENRADGSGLEEYKQNNAEANRGERTADTTDTRVHDLSLNGDNSNGSSNGGPEDLSVHDGSQKTSKNTDKSSHDKSSSGSGRKENRADGSGLEEYKQNNAEANRGERTADTTDTRLHDLSLNGDNSNGSSNGGPEDLSVHDGSQKTSKNTDKSSHDKSSSGSGRKENRADGSIVEEYNYNNAEANRGERTADTTDTRVHDLSLNGDSNGC